MNLRSILLCVFASIYFLSCKKDANEKIPFKGSYVTTSETLSAPPMVLIRITGIGDATHLGKVKFVALSTLNLTTPPPFQISGTSTNYTANGDVIYTDFTGTSTPNTEGILTVVMTHNITGGTGRFKNATGMFKGYAISDPKMPTGTLTTEGYISY